MDSISKLLEAELKATIHTHLQPHVASMREQIAERVDALITQIVEEKFRSVDLPDGFIPLNKINTAGLKIHADDIVGIPEQSQTLPGIEDLSNTVQLTLMDDCVVVEDRLVTQTLQADTLIVKDFATDQPWYAVMKQDFLASVPQPKQAKDWSFKIAEMDARISVNEKRNNLKELEVSGEAILSDVLYTTPGNKRVGINTMEPSDALTVWDQEAEIVIGKHSSQTGYIGTRRRQNLAIGANNKVGITIKNDGTVTLDKLELQGKVISSSDTIPGHAAKRGDIVLNNKPDIGDYIGWVCLDGLKWAGFGKID